VLDAQVGVVLRGPGKVAALVRGSRRADVLRVLRGTVVRPYTQTDVVSLELSERSLGELARAPADAVEVTERMQHVDESGLHQLAQPRCPNGRRRVEISEVREAPYRVDRVHEQGVGHRQPEPVPQRRGLLVVQKTVQVPER